MGKREKFVFPPYNFGFALFLKINNTRHLVGDAYHGGNCNNSLNVGTFYLNLNNSVGNANWNIGASQLIHIKTIMKCHPFASPLGENCLVCEHLLVV